MSSELKRVPYSLNTPHYPGWPGVCSSPNWVECDDCAGQGGMGVYCETCRCMGYIPVNGWDDVVIVGDVPPVDDEQFVLALTPGLPEETDWAEREQLAAAVADASAAGLADSWWAFAEQPLNMDANGDVWA